MYILLTLIPPLIRTDSRHRSGIKTLCTHHVKPAGIVSGLTGKLILLVVILKIENGYPVV